MRAVEWNPIGPAVRVIDQRQLPAQVECLDLLTIDEVADAITGMAVRGAPTIGATAGFGLALAAHASDAADLTAFWEELSRAAGRLLAARPTAINLAWALDRLMRRVPGG